MRHGAPSVYCRTATGPFRSYSVRLGTPKYPTAKVAVPAVSGLRNFHSSRPLAKEYLLADIGEGITECEIIQWFVKPGSVIAQFDKICEVQSDKATVEITSRYDGSVRRLHYKVGEMAQVGQPLIEIITSEDEDHGSGDISKSSATDDSTVDTDASSTTPPRAAPADASSAPLYGAANTSDASLLATPAVRRIAREHAINLEHIQGTGKQGRVLKEDLLRYINQRDVAPAEQASQRAVTADIGAGSTQVAPMLDDIRPLTAIQRTMFKTMTRSLQIPHFGYSDEISMDACRDIRAMINRDLASQANPCVDKISYMPILLKALSLALREYPILNARILNAEDPSAAKLQFREAHNIGIAMDTPAGLVVPNIKRVQDKSILEIASEMRRLQEAGRTNSLQPTDFADGTISLSNIGVIGGTYLSPVLVTSEVCIGAIGKIRRLPRFVSTKDSSTGKVTESVTAQGVMNISWSADHRVIDGATVARFSETWKRMVENPSALLALMH